MFYISSLLLRYGSVVNILRGLEVAKLIVVLNQVADTNPKILLIPPESMQHVISLKAKENKQ
jgi:hypothetical protein